MDNELLSTEIFSASIRFGIGAIKSLAGYLGELDVSKPLIITDEGVVKAGVIDKVTQPLSASGIEYSIFDAVQPNPVDRNVMDGLESYRDNKCDGILGVGGGSSIDVAKAVGFVARHPGHISEYYYPEMPAGETLVLIAIPTTSGTGTEVSRGSIITDTGDNRKRFVITGPPSLALVDPELTLSMPPFLTAATGMDALSHSIEAYGSNIYNPLAGAIAIAGIRLVAENLKRAVEDGTDIEARKNMAMASTMGALAFSKGLGAVHSLAHQLSTEAGMSHGLANSIMLPHVMEFNLEAAAQKYADIAQAMGVNVEGTSIMEAARSSVESVHRLAQDVGIPDRLRDAGVKEESIPAMAANAMADHCHAYNPRKCTENSMSALYRAAF